MSSATMLIAIWSSGSATRAVMCIASMRRSSRPFFSASRSASAKHCLASAGFPAERSRRPRSRAMRTGTTPPDPASPSRTWCPSSYFSCRPSARATWVRYAARSSLSVAAAASRKRRSEPAGSLKSHSFIGSVTDTWCMPTPVLQEGSADFVEVVRTSGGNQWVIGVTCVESVEIVGRVCRRLDQHQPVSGDPGDPGEGLEVQRIGVVEVGVVAVAAEVDEHVSGRSWAPGGPDLA